MLDVGCSHRMRTANIRNPSKIQHPVSIAYARILNTTGETHVGNTEQWVKGAKRARDLIKTVSLAAFAMATLQAQKLTPKDPGPRQDASGGAIMTGLTGIE